MGQHGILSWASLEQFLNGGCSPRFHKTIESLPENPAFAVAEGNDRMPVKLSDLEDFQGSTLAVRPVLQWFNDEPVERLSFAIGYEVR